MIELDGDLLSGAGYCVCESGRRAMAAACNVTAEAAWTTCYAACNDTRASAKQAATIPMRKTKVSAAAGNWWATATGTVVSFAVFALLAAAALVWLFEKCRRPIAARASDTL